MPDLSALHALARAVGVHTEYTDGLGRHVDVAPETLVRVCAAVGAQVTRPGDAGEALRAHLAARHAEVLPPVLVAWDGLLPAVAIPKARSIETHLLLEDGTSSHPEPHDGTLILPQPLPAGYHSLTVEADGRTEVATIIAAPVGAYRRPGNHSSWGVGTQLAALRSRRSRSVGDLRDLEALCSWIAGRGGDLVTVLPLLPTFNTGWPEPSPYSPVSRLFWSELFLDLEDGHRTTAGPASLDVTQADAEVRAALAGRPMPELTDLDEELFHYARFRGAQVRLGRNWRDWPPAARDGQFEPDQIDPGEERFHLVAQSLARRQLHGLRARLDQQRFRLGLDLAVGIHPDGYDPWSRQPLFAAGMSVGAPPDRGFPSGQDWGFSPVLPGASRHEGHRYLAASIAHQMELAGVLRVDHIMAWTRLYWIPHGLGLHEGTYVSYPADELFAVLTLESVRHRCEVVGENLGTVPPEIDAALPRHRIWGMYLAEFQGADDCPEVTPPSAADVALIGTHDTPTFAGWIGATDVEERIRHRLLDPGAESAVRAERARAARRLADRLGGSLEQPLPLLASLLEWLGASDSPLVVPWIEDLWLEDVGVNLPGTRSSERPNWQRPMRWLLDDVMSDASVSELLHRLSEARAGAAARHAT